MTVEREGVRVLAREGQARVGQSRRQSRDARPLAPDGRRAQLHARRAQPSESRDLARWVAEHHYLRSTPPGFVFVLEFTLAAERIGAVIVGRPSARQYDVDRILEITRLYFIDETPPNVESRGLALARKHVRVWLPQIRLLIAYSDPEQGHEGIVYEADGWCPFGMTDGAWGKGWKSRDGRRNHRVSRKQRWVRTP